MSNCIIYISCLSKEYHKQLPSEFLDLGYNVSSPFDDKTFCEINGIVCMIVYKLDWCSDKSIEDVCIDIKKCFNNIKGYYYSVVLSGTYNTSTYLMGNIRGETDPSRVLQMKALW